MPRSLSLIAAGILTVNDVSKLTGISQPTIRRLFDSSSFDFPECKGYRVPASKERRIPAPSLMRYLRENKMPIPRKLEEFVKAYNLAHVNKSQPTPVPAKAAS